MNAYFIIDDWCDDLHREGFVLMHGNPSDAIGTTQGEFRFLYEAIDKAARSMVEREPLYRVKLARRHGTHSVRVLQGDEMRYSLHDAEGHRIGEAETAQGIADIAEHGTWSYDTSKGIAFPCTVWHREANALVGTQYRYRSEAMRACAALVKELQ